VSGYERRIRRVLLSFSVSFVLFLLLLAVAEHHGLSRFWLGPIFLFSTVMMYALVGIRSRTTDPEEYYVAGRRIPPMYNGMAAAADWMSAASFISMAGGLYLQGYGGDELQAGGLAYVLGWTGGFCLVALLIAPHLRRLNLYTLPDYFAVRFGGRAPRIIAALAAVLCSFLYVVAQIYGIGLIASRLTGVQFEIGILLGIGGVLLCSFLGGMKAITWTQVAQYVVMLLAFVIPVSWLAYKQLGNPAAPLVYGRQLPRISALEDRIARDPAERQVAAIFLARAREYEARLRDVDGSLARDRAAAQQRVRALKQQGADSELVFQANRALTGLPRDAQRAREQWTRAMNESYERARPLGGVPRHSQPFAGDPKGTPDEREAFELSRRNFLALMFCLMVGTAGLPHLLTRYYTTPTVAGARSSVAWSLFFIVIVYVSAPALATLVKFEVMNNLVGSSFASLPPWIAQWARVDPSLISVADVNGDGILQWGEIRLGADIIMLATPELGGLPYVVSGLVAAGGLAAALSTADGLLLTISNALVHDIVWQDVRPSLRPQQAVILSKFVLMAAALVAAGVASARPAEILPLVSASFSLAASAFVPAMVLGMLWRGMNRAGAVAAMLCGLGVTVYYMALHMPAARAALGLAGTAQLWFGIQPLSAAVFGVPAGFAAGWLASLLARRAA
jgi:cation/acetate symporter